MIYAAVAVLVLALLYFRFKKSKQRNKICVHDCIMVSEQYSIYSKQLDGGRQFCVLNNSAPLTYRSSVYNSSSLDKAVAFLKRIEAVS